MPRVVDTMDRLNGHRRSIALLTFALAALGASAVVGVLTTDGPAAFVVFVALTITTVPGLMAVKVAFERGQLDRVRNGRLSSELGELRTQISAAHHELDQIRHQLGEVGDQAERTRELAAGLHGRAERLAAVDDELRERVDRERSAVGQRISEVVVSVDTLRAEQLRQREAHENRLALLDEKARVNSWNVLVERRRRIARDAEQRSSGGFPQRMLLQMTLARSGSTRLFDILRCHPDVFMEPSNGPWKALGLAGRRYPIGLSDLPGAATPITVLDDLGALVRGMSTDDPGVPDPATGTVAVEKAHPAFFDFDVDAFLEGVSVSEQRHRAKVDILYQVRSPLEVMWSMAEYKAREPSWHGNLEIEDIPSLVLRSLRSIEDLNRHRPGIVIDYSDVQPDSSSLNEIGALIAPGSQPDAHAEWLDHAFDRTARERLGEATAFVGERSDRTPEGPDSIWKDQHEVLDQANTIYEAILAHRSASVEPSG